MKNQQSLVEAIQNWTPNHALRQWYWFPLAYFQVGQDPIYQLLRIYDKLKKISTENYEDIIKSEKDRALMEEQKENGSAEKLRRRIIHDTVIVLTSLNRNNANLGLYNPYNVLANFIWNEQVYEDLTPDQAKKLLNTIRYWITWVNHTIPLQERFQKVVMGSIN